MRSAPERPGRQVPRRSTSRNTRLADRYRRDRILLAGDAAHVHFGLGGPGLNLGLSDVVNLGWKLAAEITGRAPAGLFDSYHRERHPYAERVNQQTRIQEMLLSPGAQVDALRQDFQDYLSDEDNPRQVAATMAGSDLACDMGDGVPPHPPLGRLVPDLRLTTSNGSRTRVAELMRAARPVLLDLTPDRALARTTAPFDVVSARCAGRPDVAGLLLRPDGYVAWAADRRPPPAVVHKGLDAALSRWFTAV